MKKRNAPMLSTSFSEPAKCAKRRFSNILDARKKRRGAGLFTLAAATFILCGLCIACTDASIGIIGGADGPTAIFTTSDSGDIKKLYDSKIKYVGNASGVGKIISLTPFLNNTDGMELYTTEPPYGVGVYTHAVIISDAERDMYKRAAAILICLVDNLDYAQLVNRDNGEVLCSFTRAELDDDILYSFTRAGLSGESARTLREYAESYEAFSELVTLLTGADEAPESNAISNAILSHNSGGYLSGECIGEGHVILGSEQCAEGNILYLITSYGEYGFENGRFVKVSGSGAIPVRLTLAPDNTVIEYKEPMDGSYWLPSLKEMFPKGYVDIVLNQSEQYYNDCIAQEEQYARAYLKSIGRNAPVGETSDERDKLYPLPDMNVEASNTLLDLFWDYPYWLGTQEKIEDGRRFVYEKSWEDKGNGNGTVTFMKYLYGGSYIAEKYVIEVNGGELNYLEGEPRTSRE